MQVEKIASELGVAPPEADKLCVGYIVMISWVDDVRHFGSDRGSNRNADQVRVHKILYIFRDLV